LADNDIIANIDELSAQERRPVLAVARVSGG
jgi:hypothetical protein